MFDKCIFFVLFLWSLIGVFGWNAVLEGESVTLNPDLTEIQGNNEIAWTFGPTNILIIKLTDGEVRVYDHHAEGRFRHRLKLDNQTGSLTIMNTTTSDSGLYTVTSSSRFNTFNVNVYPHLPIPLVSRDCSVLRYQSCSVLCLVVNVSHVTLSWLKGNSLLSSISVSDLSISLSLPLEVEDQENNTYSCQINNNITHQTTHLNISQTCQPCEGIHHCGSTEALVRLVLSAVVGMTIVVVLVYDIRS